MLPKFPAHQQFSGKINQWLYRNIMPYEDSHIIAHKLSELQQE
jgi:hypothetical protein